jgi:pyridinium-3,5-biscarboxylic acid mononucleotide sulfurtransferase
MTPDEKLSNLRQILSNMGSLVVAYSGGVDSSLLLSVACETLGEHALGVIADSESLPREELQQAVDLAAERGWPVVTVQTHEIEREGYRINRQDRCFHCKDELFVHLEPIARDRGLQHIAYGANVDDLSDIRPGHRAARQHGVRAPLVEAELTKDEIRTLARQMGLPVWDKPAFACLSSRVPFGTPVTAETLARIEAAEDALRALGFRQFRVRHHDTIARVEVGPDELSLLLDPATRERLTREIKAAGYTYATLDLDGYRTGSMHEVGRSIPLHVVG